MRPGNVLVAVRNPNSLRAPEEDAGEDRHAQDRYRGAVGAQRHPGRLGRHGLEPDQLFSDDETELFSKVVSLAEKAGKHVELMVVPGTDPNMAGVQTAQRLQSSRIVAGLSTKMSPAEQGSAGGRGVGEAARAASPLSLEIIVPETEGQSMYFNLGPHPPQLWPEDIDLVHNLWLELDETAKGAKLRHRDVIGVALRRLEAQLHSRDRDSVIQDTLKEAGLPSKAKSDLAVQ